MFSAYFVSHRLPAISIFEPVIHGERGDWRVAVEKIPWQERASPAFAPLHTVFVRSVLHRVLSFFTGMVNRFWITRDISDTRDNILSRSTLKTGLSLWISKPLSKLHSLNRVYMDYTFRLKNFRCVLIGHRRSISTEKFVLSVSTRWLNSHRPLLIRWKRAIYQVDRYCYRSFPRPTRFQRGKWRH